MSPQEAISYLESFINHELSLDRASSKDFRTDRLKHFLGLIGDPEQSLKTVHIAGTKGKGSVAAMTANILVRAGYRVGLFTSPHLRDFRERIRCLFLQDCVSESNDIFSGMISCRDLEKMIDELKPEVDRLHSDGLWGRLTYFELTTALAVYYFSKQKVDIVVLETGVGGRLDATNVCPSIVCALTPISFDHMNLLGNTLTEIAQEKAAIIKTANQRVVMAPQTIEAQRVIEQRCREIGARYYQVTERVQWRLISQEAHQQVFELISTDRSLASVVLPLLGEHQLANAATVLGIVDNLTQIGYKISDQAVMEGFRTVFWPGRLEILQNNPTVIVDSAHNPASMSVLVEAIRNSYAGVKIALIFGAAKDKDVAGMIAVLNLLPLAKVVVTGFNHPRAYQWTKEEAARLFSGRVVELAHNTRSAIDIAMQDISADTIIVGTGSIFMISEVRELCVR